MTTTVLIGYALFLILGGIMGLKKGSKISFAMGVVSGILVLAGWFALRLAGKPGWIFLTGLNALLAISFISRLIKTRKFMPSGMLLLVTLAVLFFCLSKIF